MSNKLQKTTKLLGGSGVIRLALVLGGFVAILFVMFDFLNSSIRLDRGYEYIKPILNFIIGFCIGFTCPIAGAWVWRGFKKE